MKGIWGHLVLSGELSLVVLADPVKVTDLDLHVYIF